MGFLGDIFGGKPVDNTASILQAQREADDRARAAEQARYDQEQARVASDKAAEVERLAQEESKRQSDLQAAQVENAKQAEAAKATGTGYTFENTRSDAAKALAATQTGGVGLPGYSALSRFAQTSPGGYQGQQNSLTSGGFNSQQVGGRRYV